MGGITCPSPVGRAFPRHGQLGHGPCFLKRVKAEGTPAILSTPDWPRRPWYAAFPSVQPSFPRSAILPHFTSAVEAEVLQSRGVLDPVIQTMLEPENRSPPGSITVIGRRTSVGASSTFSIPLSVYTPRVLAFSPIRNGAGSGSFFPEGPGLGSISSLPTYLRLSASGQDFPPSSGPLCPPFLSFH